MGLASFPPSSNLGFTQQHAQETLRLTVNQARKELKTKVIFLQGTAQSRVREGLGRLRVFFLRLFIGRMQPQDTGVQYSRWNDSGHDEVSVNTSTAEVSGCNRIYTKLCTGKIGIAIKVIGGNIVFWTIFIIGYVTGYYVHKCK